MTDKKKMEIVFAPGCFDQFDGTQEELDELMTKIQEMADSGELQEMAIPLSEALDELTEEELQALLEEVSEEVGVEELNPSFTNKRILH